MRLYVVLMNGLQFAYLVITHFHKDHVEGYTKGQYEAILLINMMLSGLDQTCSIQNAEGGRDLSASLIEFGYPSW